MASRVDPPWRSVVGNWMRGVFAGVVLSMLALLVAWSGLIDIRWPWERLPEIAEVETEFALPEGARIVSVEPLTLDCRARIQAVVPIEGVRRHRLLGQVYRSDRMELHAIGDVDTCVEGSGVDVAHHDDGSTEVVVPAASILFVRPRVDAMATASSVSVTKGTVGKVTDIFPWVDESSGLVPEGYAYAQDVIGGSACMQAAYAETVALLVDGYHRQFVEQGLDPDRLTVRVEGQPDFAQNESFSPPGGVELSVASGDATCVPADGPAVARDEPSR